jgi:serine protease Do
MKTHLKRIVLLAALGAFAHLVFRAPMTLAQTVGEDEISRGLLATPRVFAAAADRIRPTLVTIESFGGVSALQGVIGGIRQQGEGNTTGVVISPDGYVVTSSFNFIQQPNVITVVTSDGQRRLAKLLGRDDTRQICLLKIEGVSDLPVPELCDPAEIQVGQWAMSIGVGYGDVNPAISLGIVSAKNRAGGRAIQTDANISPANYGGPLIDAAGRLIGICVPLNPNSLNKGAGVEWYDSGIGFAIPLFGLEDRLGQMKAGKNFYPAYLGVVVAATGDDKGVRVEMVDSLEARRKAAADAKAKKSKLKDKDEPSEDEPSDKPSPLEVDRPEDYDYPALKAGILAGDLIVSLNDQSVVDTRSLRIALGRFNAGEKVDVHIVRGAEQKTIAVELGRPPKTALTAHQLRAGPPPGN